MKRYLKCLHPGGTVTEVTKTIYGDVKEVKCIYCKKVLDRILPEALQKKEGKS